nr:MAG TPA_asm: hypothetical protein [Caudoviricetes sp.]
MMNSQFCAGAIEINALQRQLQSAHIFILRKVRSKHIHYTFRSGICRETGVIFILFF